MAGALRDQTAAIECEHPADAVARARDALLARGASALVSWGVAGGIDPHVESGTVVVPEFVIDPGGGSQRTDPEWRDRLLTGIRSRVPVSTGAILHSERIVASVGEKRILHQRWRAAAAATRIR